MTNPSELAHKSCPRCNRTVEASARFCVDCGFDFQNVRTQTSPGKRNLFLAVGGIAVLFGTIILTGYLAKKSTNTPSATPTPLNYAAGAGMSEKANQAELKIVQGQTLSATDLNGLSANELRMLRNRSEEHTSELQSHSFISYAVFCLKQ